MLIHGSKIIPRFFTDPLREIEDTPICNAGVFSDLTQFGEYLFCYQLILEDFELSIAEYQHYNVLNSSMKGKIKLQDPVIYTAMCLHHTSDL